MSPLFVLGLVAMVPLGAQVFFYWKVVWVDGAARSEISQVAVALLGLIPLVGLLPLMETYNRDRKPRPHPVNGGRVLRVLKKDPRAVGKVSARQAVLDYDPADLINDYLTDERLGDLGLDDLDTLDS